jgi:hypothetical protein
MKNKWEFAENRKNAADKAIMSIFRSLAVTENALAGSTILIIRAALSS